MEDSSRLIKIINTPYRYRWLMFVIVGIIYFLTILHRISPTIIARDLALAFNTDATSLGIIASAYFFTYSGVQPPVGILSDTIGPKKVITIFTFIAFLGGMVFSSATSVPMAVIGRALIGAGVGGIFIPTIKIFSQWFKASEFASLTGIFLSFGSTGGLAAGLPLTYLVLLLGWRSSFTVLAMVSLVMAALCWFIVRDRPEDMGWQPIVMEEEADTQSINNQPDENITIVKRIGIVFRNINFWFLTLSTFFAGGAGITFLGLWAVPYLIDVHAMSRMQAGGLLMMIPLGFSLGSPAFGVLTDRLKLNRKIVVIIAQAVSMCTWVLMLLVGDKLPPLAFYGIFLVMGICTGGSLPLFITITKELFPPWLTGTAVGLMNPAAFFAAALFQPFTGYLLDMVGPDAGGAYPLKAYQNVFTAFLISYVISLFILLLLRLPKATPDTN